jgi:hypothetical protein
MHQYQFTRTDPVLLSQLAAEIEAALSKATAGITFKGAAVDNNLRIDFESELTADEQLGLETVVELHEPDPRKIILDGSHEILNVSDGKWIQHKAMVKFSAPLNEVPEIVFTGAVFENTADLVVLEVTKEYFVFAITSLGQGTMASVEFDWEARKA